VCISLDEFYPTEVDFNRLVNGEDLPVGIQYLSPDMSLLQMPRLIPMYDGIGMLPYSAMPLPPQYPTQFVAAFPHNPYYPVLQPSIPYPQLVENSTSIVNENRSVYTEKNDVIMIPPTLPKSLPVRASSSSVGGGSNSSVRSDDEDDVKSAKSSGKGGKSVGKTVGTRPGDESGDNQRFERRFVWFSRFHSYFVEISFLESETVSMRRDRESARSSYWIPCKTNCWLSDRRTLSCGGLWQKGSLITQRKY
jgi:hypothetical protein